MLAKLKSLTTHDAYAIKGGVVLLSKPDGSITPAHVMDALNNVLAEVGAIKEKIGVSEPTKYAALKSGQTPSNVYDSIEYAISLVNILINKSSWRKIRCKWLR